MNIGRAIKEARKRKGISQGKLSELIGISQTSLSQIEGNIKRPSMATIGLIADQLDISVGGLYMLSMEDADVAPGKFEIYQAIRPTLETIFTKHPHIL